MVDSAAVAEEESTPPPPRRRRLRKDWPRRLATELGVFLIGLLVLLAAGLVLLDTAPGHRFIADRIAQIETASGLKIRIGRIEGSIFGEARLKNIAVSDPKGVFLTSPEIRLDWAPGAWLYNSLHIDSLTADQVTLRRLPETRPTGREGPLLPDFDIHIGELAIERLILEPPVTGKRRVGKVRGTADIRAGRAMIDLKAALDGDGDRIAIALDADPDRDRFDLGMTVRSPADGLIPALAGLQRAIDLRVTGDGTWSQWRGKAELDVAGRPAARLQLTAEDGRFGATGALSPSQYLSGTLRRLTGPTIKVVGNATFEDNLLDGRLTLGSSALRAVASGAVDFGDGAYRQLRLGVDLLQPKALFPNMAGRDVRMVWTLDGAYATANYAYRVTAPTLSFDQTGFVDVRAEGKGRFSPWPMRVPLRLSARAITGIGEVAGAILANPRIEGILSVGPDMVRGDKLRLTSDRVRGNVSLLLNLRNGEFEILLSGGIARYAIPGIGIVDVQTDLRVVPGPGGRGTRIVGTAKAWVRRLDNSFFQSLTGGLPRIETRLERGDDGILRFTDLQFYSPKLRLSGEGRRNVDGTFHITARGRQSEYGPLRITLDGNIARPNVELFLERPNEALGLSNVRLSLAPTPAGFDYRASGGSTLGPFTSRGRILLPNNGRAVISIAELRVEGLTASGDLRSDPGGFSGRLQLAGSLSGTLDFSPVSGAQQIEAHLVARNARFPDRLAVRNGKLDAIIRLADGETTIQGTAQARGLEVAGMTLARLDASARIVNGQGRIQANMAGRRGADFTFKTIADVSANRIVIRGDGSVEGRALVFAQPAVLNRTADGWELERTRMTFNGGEAVVSGRTGSRPEIHAELRGMPLEVLDLAWPGLDLSGSASGRLDYSWRGNRTGRADLKIRGLSRAGLVLSSKPIDLGLAAIITGDKAALRAVAVSDGKTIGRAQARFAPLGPGAVFAELMNAPLFAQLRYAGPADTLWRLSGTELFDVTGPVAIGADIRGRLVDPQIRGSVRSSEARLESAVTGTVLENLAVEAAFNGSRLIFQRLGGQTPGGGSLTGSGVVTFSGGRTALDLKFNADNALLLDRDDVAGRVSGPLAIRSNGNGGEISGQFKLENGRFTLGQAGAAASVPSLDVVHRGLDEEEVISEAELQPWRLNIDLAGGDLRVRGLGISSLWTTDLKVRGSVAEPRFNGRADLIRGDYEFAGRNFRLERGIIRFRGETPPDPQLDIVAAAEVQGLDATVRVGGTGGRPEITFASVPALPQDELLSRILFGTSITNLSAAEALQLASAVSALQSGGGGLDPINSIRRAVGLDRLRILPADVATGRGTALAAGKYVTRKLFVEVVTDGQGYSATRAEYQVTRWLSLLSTISTVGRTSANVRISKDY